MLLEHNLYTFHEKYVNAKERLLTWCFSSLEAIYAQIDATITLSKFVVVPCWRHLC